MNRSERPLAPLLLLLLGACQPAAVTVSDTDASQGLAQLAGDQADQADQLTSLLSRMDESEARLDACEANVASLQASVEAQAETLVELQADLEDQGDAFEAQLAALTDAFDVTVAALQADLEDLGDSVSDLVNDLEDLDDAVADLGGTVAGTPAHVTASATSASAIGGSSGTWSSIIADQTITVAADDVVIVLCSATDNAGAYSQYRISVSATDGSWSGTSEAVGDTSTALLAYPGEALTVSGMFTASSAGDVTIACQGRYATAYDISLLAFTL